MDEFGNTIGGARRIKGLTLFLLIFLIPFLSHAGSIREVSQSVERVKSIEAPVQFAVLGDSRDGKKVYTKLIQKILERKPHFIIHLGDMISKPCEKEWEEFFEISKAIDISFFPVIGNHEVAGPPPGRRFIENSSSFQMGRLIMPFKREGPFLSSWIRKRGRGKL